MGILEDFQTRNRYLRDFSMDKRLEYEHLLDPQDGTTSRESEEISLDCINTQSNTPNVQTVDMEYRYKLLDILIERRWMLLGLTLTFLLIIAAIVTFCSMYFDS